MEEAAGQSGGAAIFLRSGPPEIPRRRGAPSGVTRTLWPRSGRAVVKG